METSKGSILPPKDASQAKEQQDFNQQIADKYNQLVNQVTSIPAGLDAAGIIEYLKNLKI